MIANLVEKHCRNIFTHPWLYLALLLFLTGIAGYFYATLPIETSVESLIIDNDPDLLFYEEFKEQFGEDEVLIVGFKHDKIISPEILSFIKEKTRQLETIPEIKEVVSLTNVEDLLGTENDFIVRPLVEKIPESLKALKEIKARTSLNPLINGNIISTDGTAALFLLRTKAHPDDEGYDLRLIEQTKEILSNDNPFNIDFHFAGWLVTDVSMSGYMNRDMAFFMPLTYILIAGLLWLFLRNIICVAISLVTVSIALVWTMALLNLSGGAMSPMTSTLPPLIMALVVSDCIHIFCKFLRQERNADLPKLLQNNLKSLVLPCFLTSLTTAIGFLSLTLSSIPPIRHFGLAAAGGMIAEFGLAMTIIPLAIYGLRNNKYLLKNGPRQSSRQERLIQWWADNFQLYKRGVLITTFIALIISIFGFSRLTVETNLLEYFKTGSEIRTSAAFTDHNLGGANTIEISIRADKIDYFRDPANLLTILKISDYFSQQPMVSKATSINNFLMQMNQAFHNDAPEFNKLPENRALLSQYLLLYDGEEMNYFINEDYNWARLSFRITEHSSKKLEKHLLDLKSFINRNFAVKNLDIRITGKTQLANKLINSIVESQIKSLAAAFLIIFLILFLVFKSLKLGLLSIIPNTLPLIFNFGIMGLMDIPLNTATAIISAIAIGIAVDDTIHFITEYQNGRKNGLNQTAATAAALKHKGEAMLTTSIVLIGSFAILCFSSFVPTVQFGFLCSVIMLTALVSDIVILPALLKLK